jgi:hypothetical protein
MKYIITLLAIFVLSNLGLCQEPELKSTKAKAAVRDYERKIEDVDEDFEKQLKDLEKSYQMKSEILRARLLSNLNAAMVEEAKRVRLEEATEIKELIKQRKEAELPTLDQLIGRTENTKVKKRIPRDSLQFRGHHYYVVLQGAPWHVARRNAAEWGGHLLLIDSLEEHAFIAAALNERSLRNLDFWIDGTCEEDETTYLSFSRNKIDLKNCRLGGLDKADGENYLRLDGTDDRWTVNDTHPQYKNNFIIEWEK